MDRRGNPYLAPKPSKTLALNGVAAKKTRRIRRRRLEPGHQLDPWWLILRAKPGFGAGDVSGLFRSLVHLSYPIAGYARSLLNRMRLPRNRVVV